LFKIEAFSVKCKKRISLSFTWTFGKTALLMQDWLF